MLNFVAEIYYIKPMRFWVTNQKYKTMRKILSNICTWAALCMMGAATFTACSSDDNALDGSPVENPTTQTYP